MNNELIFVSYNIRSSVLDEASCSDEFNEWSRRKSAVCNLIRKQNACIFWVQEDSRGQLDDLQKVFSSEYSIIAYPESVEENNEEFNTLFVSKSFDIIESGFRFISETPHKKSKLQDSICYRHLTYARVRIEEEVFLIINVHLDHSENYDFKRIEAECFMKIVSELQEGDSIILMGDFNIIADVNDAYRTIARALMDVSKVFQVREPTHPNWLMWNVYTQIDYFFVSPHLASRLGWFQIIKDRYRRPDGIELEPSDHFLIKSCIRSPGEIA